MGIAITFCDETNYERRKDKHDNSLFGRGKAESLPDLVEFETHSVFQLQINTNGDEFIKSRNLNEETGLTLQHFNALTRRSIRHSPFVSFLRHSKFVLRRSRHFPSGVETSVPGGGVNSHIDAGIGNVGVDPHFELSMICCAFLIADSSGALSFFRMSIVFCAEAVASFLLPSFA